MRSRLRLFLFVAVLLFIVHMIVSFAVADWLTTTLNGHGPFEARFAPSFAAALCALPLLNFTPLNSIIVGIVAASILLFLRWRAIVAIFLAAPLVLLLGMIGTSMVLEQRIERGWRELAPRPIIPAPRGTLQTALGNEPVTSLTEYLKKELARDDATIDPPPQEVAWYLTAHRSEIDALRRQLPANDRILGRYRMQLILLVDALQSRSPDEVQAAERVSDALLHQPNFVSAIYAIRAAEDQLGVMRKLGGRVPLPSFDPHQALIDAIAAQSAVISKERAPWYARPYARLCQAEGVWSAVRQAKTIRAMRGGRVESVPVADAKPRVPFNPVGVMTGGANLAARANRLLRDRQRAAVSLAARTQ